MFHGYLSTRVHLGARVHIWRSQVSSIRVTAHKRIPLILAYISVALTKGLDLMKISLLNSHSIILSAIQQNNSLSLLKDTSQEVRYCIKQLLNQTTLLATTLDTNLLEAATKMLKAKAAKNWFQQTGMETSDLLLLWCTEPRFFLSSHPSPRCADRQWVYSKKDPIKLCNYSKLPTEEQICLCLSLNIIQQSDEKYPAGKFPLWFHVLG